MREKIEIDVDAIKKHLGSLAPSTAYSDVASLFSNYNVNSLHEYWAKRCEKISKDMSDYFVVNSSYNSHTTENFPAYIDHIEKYEYFLKKIMLFSDDDARKILRKLRICEYKKTLIYDTKNNHDCSNTDYDFISWLIFLDYGALFSGNGSKDLTVDESASGHHLEKLDYLLGCLFAMENARLSQEDSFETLFYNVSYLLLQFGFDGNYAYYVKQYAAEHD
mgnify:CR=1 FL=1